MQLDGSHQDVDRFAQLLQDGGVGIELLSPFERRMSWDLFGYSGSLSATSLRSGIALTAARLRWEQSSVMVFDNSPSRLEFVLSRGAGTRVKTNEGANYVLGSGVFHVGQVKRPVRLECDFSERSDGEFQEHICLNIDGTRLNELLGTQALPASIERVVSSAAAYPRLEQPMGPELFRLLDEIVYCDARGISRQILSRGQGARDLGGDGGPARRRRARRIPFAVSLRYRALGASAPHPARARRGAAELARIGAQRGPQ